MNCGTVAIAVVVCGTLLVALLMILLAMPNSRLRSAVMEILGWTVSAGSAALLISPIDLVPIFVPVLGQVDDVGYIIAGIGGALLAYRQRQQRDLLPPAD